MNAVTVLRLGGGVLAATFASQSLAIGTLADTNVLNTATVNYDVNNNGVDVAQPPVDSNTVDFEVDRRIILTVAENGDAYTFVSPNGQREVLEYTITNTSNSVQDVRLAVTPGTDPFGGNDNFDADNVSVFVESGATPGYQAAEDTQLFADELDPDTSIIAYVVADIPVDRADGDVAAYTLTGTAADAGTAGVLGDDSVETAGADDPSVVDTVFGDGAGDTDAANDGQFSDTDAYLVRTATLIATKSSIVLSDPVNGTTQPKRIPGATVQYCIEVANNGAADATNLVITDTVGAAATPAQPVTYAPGSIIVDSANCAAQDGTTQTDATGDDISDFTAGTVTSALGTLSSGATRRIQFSVVID